MPALGNYYYYYDALSPADVQRWIDGALLRGWTSETRGSKQDKTRTVRRSYSRDTVQGWEYNFVNGANYAPFETMSLSG